MSQLKRRQFLQFATSALTTLGLSQLDIQRQGLRYAKTLAQRTPRKLALLVGINSYAENPLQGCMTDVDLQQELLIHRFGFNPADILIVTDKADVKPTRAGILQAFEEHLIKQAKPGDVVVFHYSGHGSQVYDPDSGFPDQLNSTFVPINREISQKGERAVVSDIMGETLFLLMSNLKTENVTVVLDSCHSGGGKRGNLTIRAIDGGKSIDPSPIEREYQKQLISRLGVTPEEVKKRRQESIAKGVVIASAARDQLAADTPFDGFHAGAFTYALTQYLWQATGNEGVSSVVANVSRSTTQISSTRQVPEFEMKKDTDNDRKPTFFLNKQAPPAEAVITKIEGDKVEFWLGGIEPRSIAAFNKGAVFLLLDDFKGLGVPGAIALAPNGTGELNDGLLTSNEIFDLKLNAELVVLSACDTGRGRLTGDGVIGLSRSLITAGVPSVIVSLWSVPDAPTASLMTQFYQNLKQNPDKAQALRQAMVTTMKTHPNPKDWAAFTLIGEAQ